MTYTAFAMLEVLFEQKNPVKPVFSFVTKANVLSKFWNFYSAFESRYIVLFDFQGNIMYFDTHFIFCHC